MKTIAVIFGGKSTEHDVSVVTAIASIIKPLELSGNFKVEAIYISKDGRWFWDEKLKDISLYRSGDIDEFIRKAAKVHLLFDDGLTLVKSSQFAGRKQYKKIDVVFPAMHGTHGEDGELMGILEMAGVPYVGCGVASSAIAMDKVLAKLTLESLVPTTKMQYITSSEFSKDAAGFTSHVIKNLNFPVFVKPTHLGSSIGITQVKDPDGLLNAIEVALHYDDKVLVEEAVPNLIELTLPIMGNEEPIPALLEQPLSKAADFFDFETKYMQGGKKGKGKSGTKGSQGYSTIPAKIPQDLYQKAEAVALKVYKELGCSGIARVDLLVNSKTNQVYFNEVNPMPGGLYAHNWRAKGISSIDLVTKLIDYAQQRFNNQSRLNTTFSTNYLKQF
ncbi:MAG: D-alanine--D-alanine ligase [Patescibacteria group bacterium]